MNDTLTSQSRPLLLGALALVLAFLASTLAACVHEVESGHGDGAPIFIFEGKELIDQLGDAGDGYRTTPLIPADEEFTRVGIRFDASGPVAIDVRITTDGGDTFTDWREATLSFHEERANNAFADVGANSATHVQLRFAAPVESGLSFLAVEALVPAEESGEEGAIDVAGDSTEEQGLAADGIVVTRAQWGARARTCSGASTPNRMTIHHTETPTADDMSPAARMRQIQNFHIDVRGWCDIGYHFVVAGNGQVFAGRRENIIGAHVLNANSNNAGISLMGNFISAPPSQTQMEGAARIMRAVASTYGITLDRTKVKSHRELGSTDCPGNALQARLADLVTLARNSSGGGGSQPPPPPPPPPPPGDDDDTTTSNGVYGGIDRGTASIPRAGLANDTLRNALGMTTEPHGNVVTHQGAQFVRGTVSWFGGPNDTGVSSTETGAVSGERLRSLNSPTNASASTIASRPGDFYFIAMRWDYTPHGIAFWRNARILVVNPQNNAAVVLRVVDWGPNTSTGRILDISPRAMTDLGADTDDQLLVAFATEGAALGPTNLGAVVTPPPPPPSSSCTALQAGGGVIDDGDDCFTLGGPTQYLHAVDGAGEDGDYVWTGTTDNGAAVNYAEWIVKVGEPGRYVVEAFVPSVTSPTTRARYDVTHDGGTSTVVVSQSGSGWKRIGAFNFGAGSSSVQKVRAPDNTGDTSDRKLVLDAIRLVPDDGSSEEPTCAQLEIVTSGGSLNVRPSASTSGAAVGTLDDGDVVDRIETVTGQSVSGTTEWHRIRSGSLVGYISAAFAQCR